MNPMTAVEAEATRQVFIVATYGGCEYKLPADADDWPLDMIAVSVGTCGETLTVHHPTLMRAMSVLLDDQWPDFLRAFPHRRDLRPASNVFAAAAGFTAAPVDAAFGALPRLLATLEAWPDAVEATLGGMGIDYRDRWRHDDDGRRLLTLRRIHVRLSYADPDSPLGIAQNQGARPLTGTELLLMDVFEGVTRTKHPSRPMTKQQAAERSANILDIEAKRAEYRQRHSPAANRRAAALATAQANAKGGPA